MLYSSKVEFNPLEPIRIKYLEQLVMENEAANISG